MLADSPELLALATLAGVPASKMAAAFNEPAAFFTHLTLDELVRIRGSWERLTAVQTEMLEALNTYTEAAKTALEGAEVAD